jgi:long-chain fatty acid transport protein
MKKLSIILSLFSVLLANSLQAQHDNLINSSAEWVRTPARNAAIDASDIVIYNPAGLVRLNNGFHINVGNQSLMRKPSHSYDLGLGSGKQTFTQEGADAFLPNLYLTYKKDQWAFFSGIYIAGGGATANYPKGSINTDLIGLQVLTASQGAYASVEKQNLKASSMYLTSTLGTSYALNDQLSVAVAGRFIGATNKTQANLTFGQSPYGLADATYSLNMQEKAEGFGGVLSMMVRPSQRFNFTVRYETPVQLNFETKTLQDDFGVSIDKSKNRRDLPGTLAFGSAFSVNKLIKLYGDVNYYFQKNANWSNSTLATNGNPYAKMAGDAISYNIATTFQTSSKLILSIGGGYTDFLYSDQNGYFTKTGAFETVPTDNININTGFSYRFNSAISGTVGYMHTFYKEQQIQAVLAQPLEVTVTTKNSVDLIAVGFNLQF